jgi:hypothetical protein
MPRNPSGVLVLGFAPQLDQASTRYPITNQTIVEHQRTPFWFMLNPKREGIACDHRKCIIKRIWHNFQHLKVVALIWLILSKDILVEEWFA